jgi:flagellar motor switch protein FliM
MPRHEALDLMVGGLLMSKARPVRRGDHRGAMLERMHYAATAIN